MNKKLPTIFVTIILMLTIIISSFIVSATEIENNKTAEEEEEEPIFGDSMIHGRVMELTFGGGPIYSEGATVHCIGIGLYNKYYRPYNEVTTTNEYGNYSFGEEGNFTVPCPGTYLLYVKKEGYIPSPIYLFAGFAIVHKFVSDGFFVNASDIFPVWPPLLLIPINFGSRR